MTHKQKAPTGRTRGGIRKEAALVSALALTVKPVTAVATSFSCHGKR